jgi:hypothetical protein
VERKTSSCELDLVNWKPSRFIPGFRFQGLACHRRAEFISERFVVVENGTPVQQTRLISAGIFILDGAMFRE